MKIDKKTSVPVAARSAPRKAAKAVDVVPEPDQRRQRVQAAETCLAVLKALTTLGGRASLTAIGAAVDESPAKVHRYLASLMAEGLADLALYAAVGPGWGAWASEIYADLGLRFDGERAEAVADAMADVLTIPQVARSASCADLMQWVDWWQSSYLDAIQLTPDQIAHAKAGRWWPPVSEMQIGKMPPAIAQRRIP